MNEICVNALELIENEVQALIDNLTDCIENESCDMGEQDEIMKRLDSINYYANRIMLTTKEGDK